jgi:hypothetical protein
MTIRKKRSLAEFERDLIADAENPNAWGKPISVPPSSSPRPSSYQKSNVDEICKEPVVHLIGEVAVAFGILELYLELAIWQMVAENDEEKRKLGEAITAEMSFDRKVHAFSSMFALHFPSEANDAELKKLVGSLFAAQEKRNQILHSAWSFSDDFEAFTRMKASAKAKKGLVRTISTVEPTELLAVYKQIGQLGQRFGRFAKTRIQDRLAPRPQRHSDGPRKTPAVGRKPVNALKSARP